MSEIKLLSCPYCGQEAQMVNNNCMYYGMCSKCGLQGPLRFNEDDAHAAWDNLPRKLKTLDGKPMIDSGFYFLLTSEKGIRMCYVWNDLFSNKMCYQTIGDINIYEVTSVEGTWAGPIREPNFRGYA